METFCSDSFDSVALMTPLTTPTPSLVTAILQESSGSQALAKGGVSVNMCLAELNRAGLPETCLLVVYDILTASVQLLRNLKQ